jgi:TetR/AcrR family transcriptional regulator, cholesterol catabolism regulator
MAKIKTHTNGTKKDVILKNASSLFRINGFRATSLRELADTMNIEAPSLYNHINSKGELLHDICSNVAKDFTTHMETIISSKASAEQKIEKLIRFHIQKIYTDFDNVFVSNHEWKYLQKKQLGHFLKQRKSYENNFIALVEEGITKKAFKKLNPQITVLTILSAVRGIEFLQSHLTDFSLETLEENMVQHLLTGIKK